MKQAISYIALTDGTNQKRGTIVSHVRKMVRPISVVVCTSIFATAYSVYAWR